MVNKIATAEISGTQAVAWELRGEEAKKLIK